MWNRTTLKIKRGSNRYRPNANALRIDEFRSFIIGHDPAQELGSNLWLRFISYWFGEVVGGSRMHENACFCMSYLSIKSTSCEFDQMVESILFEWA